MDNNDLNNIMTGIFSMLTITDLYIGLQYIKTSIKQDKLPKQNQSINNNIFGTSDKETSETPNIYTIPYDKLGFDNKKIKSLKLR